MGLSEPPGDVKEISRQAALRAVAPAEPPAGGNKNAGANHKSKTPSHPLGHLVPSSARRHARQGTENSSPAKGRVAIVSVNGRDVEIMHMRAPR